MLLGLADYLQLALISVSFDSALSLLPRALSLPHHAACWAHFLLRQLHPSGQQSQRVNVGLQPIVLEDLPLGASI